MMAENEGTSVTEAELLTRVTDIVRDQLDDDDITLSASTKAKDIEGWDSLAHIRIMIAIEEAFGIQFQTSEITSLRDVGHLVSLISSRL